MKYVDNLFNWAAGVYDEFCNDSYRIKEIHDHETGITIVYDLRTGKTAFSKCRKDEEFSEEIGVAVAYTRLKGGEVPKVLQKTLLKNLVAGEEFSLFSSPKNTFYVVGENPLKSAEVIAIHTQAGNLCRFDYYSEVYKIN